MPEMTPYVIWLNLIVGGVVLFLMAGLWSFLSKIDFTGGAIERANAATDRALLVLDFIKKEYEDGNISDDEMEAGFKKLNRDCPNWAPTQRNLNDGD